MQFPLVAIYKNKSTILKYDNVSISRYTAKIEKYLLALIGSDYPHIRTLLTTNDKNSLLTIMDNLMNTFTKTVFV